MREWLRETLWRPMPAARLACLRILTGGFATGYLIGRLPHYADFSRFDAFQFNPVGVASWLTAPLPGALTWGAALAAVLAGALFTLGWRFRWSGPIFAALLLWVTTYRHCWGMIFHTDNLMVTHVAVLGLLSASAHAWSLDARQSGRPIPEAHPRYGWPVTLLCAITALTYFMAGVAKLHIGGLAWITEGQLGHTIAYDAIRKLELGSVASPISGVLARLKSIWVPLALVTLIIELGAPLSLLSRSAGRWWVLAIWLFHLGVLLMMAIMFPYTTLLFGFAAFFDVEALPPVRRASKWWSS